ncbi:MetQ/NlpA family ABC transporter substrate-binding protein, partial [Escherichia coli]
AGGTTDGDGSHGSTSKTPSYTKSVSWHHYLKEGKGLLPTALDITDNPRHLQIMELEGAQLPRVLDDPKVDVAIISTTYIQQTGLSPVHDSVFIEDKNSPYVNILVAREDNKNAENVKEFLQSYQSPEVAKAAETIFNGGAVPGW